VDWEMVGHTKMVIARMRGIAWTMEKTKNAVFLGQRVMINQAVLKLDDASVRCAIRMSSITEKGAKIADERASRL
jgi:hypothetical protein